jgi:hypothetical protein
MSKVKILDYTALVNLRTSLKEFSESFEAPLATIEQDLKDILLMMKEKLDLLKVEKDRAEEELSRAESDLSDCEASQEWDEDAHCYRPTCNWERSAVRRSQSRYDSACKRFEDAERIFKEVDYEVWQYLKPFCVIQIGGAADYLRREMSKLDAADDKMGRILDLVEKYLGSKTSPEGVEKKQSEVRKELIQEATDKKYKGYIPSREVSARIDDEEEDVYGVDIEEDVDRKGAIKAFNSNKCPVCGRPVKICVCSQRELERY